MGYKLKKNVEAFEVVDGPFARKKYTHGIEYDEVPPEEAGRFEKSKPRQAAPKNPDKKTADRTNLSVVDGGKENKS